MKAVKLQIAVLITLLVCCSVQAQVQSQCGPVMGGAVINLTFECLNDSSAIVVDKLNTYGGWKYSYDSFNDHYYDEAFEIYALAYLETPTEFWLVFNSNMVMGGFSNPDPSIQDGIVHFGDFFINLSGLDFDDAIAAGELFAVNFNALNESNAAQTGVYGAVTGKGISQQNGGAANYSAYTTYVNTHGGSELYGELGANQSYYAGNLNFSVINSGTRLGAVTFLDPFNSATAEDEMVAAGLDLSKFAGLGLATYGLKFQKSLIIDECGVIGGDGKSCLDCKGVPCGTAVVDECGVCGGDGSSCNQCVEQKATKKEKKTSKEVKKAAKVLVDRVERFTDKATHCDGENRDHLVRQAEKLYKKIVKLLNTEITNTILVCDEDTCSQSSTGRTKKKLKKYGKQLHDISYEAKLDSKNVCPKTVESTSNIHSIDFYYDFEDTVNDLPKNNTSCS